MSTEIWVPKEDGQSGRFSMVRRREKVRRDLPHVSLPSVLLDSLSYHSFPLIGLNVNLNGAEIMRSGNHLPILSPFQQKKKLKIKEENLLILLVDSSTIVSI